MATAPMAPANMAKIHPESGDTVRESLDLFKVPSTETSEFKGQNIIVNPIRTPPGEIIEHIVPPSDEHYTDLANSYYVVKFKVTKADGSDLAAANALNVWLCDNFVHSLFRSASVELTNGAIEFIGDYSYNSYIVRLMKAGIESKQGRLTASGWFQDGALGMDAGESDNDAALARKGIIAKSKTVSMVFVPDMATFREKRLFPPGVAFKTVFNRNSDKYCLMSTSEDSGAKVEMISMTFHVRRIVVNPAIQRTHNRLLLKGDSEKFPLRKYRSRKRVVNEGLRSTTIILDQNSELPTMLAVAMVKHSASNGEYKESPFKLGHFNVASIELTIDGIPVGRRIETDFPGGIYASAYAHTLSSLGLLTSVKDSGVTYKKYGAGQTFFVWCTASDLPDPEEEHYFHLKQRGCIAITLSFSEPLPAPISVVFTDKREELLEIDFDQSLRMTGGVV